MTSRRRDIQLPLRILARIEQHVGKANPIKIKSLAEEFRISERAVKGYIYELVDAGYKIGSSKVEPMGVFLAKDPSEIHETAKRLYDEGIKYLVRSKKLRDWGSADPTVFEQLSEVDESLMQFEGY